MLVTVVVGLDRPLELSARMTDDWARLRYMALAVACSVGLSISVRGCCWIEYDSLLYALTPPAP